MNTPNTPNTACQVHGIFDKATWTVTYVVHQGHGTACAIIDSVLDYDPKSGRTRREGKAIYYQLSSPQALAVIQVLYGQFCSSKKE